MQAIATVPCRDKANASLERAIREVFINTLRNSEDRELRVFSARLKSSFCIQLQGRYSDVTFIRRHLMT